MKIRIEEERIDALRLSEDVDAPATEALDPDNLPETPEGSEGGIED